MPSWVFFIVLLIFIIVRAKAKSDADKKQREAQEMRKRQAAQGSGYREPAAVLPESPRANSGTDIRGIFKELFNEFEQDPEAGFPYPVEGGSAKTEDPFGMGEGSEGYNAPPSGEGAAYDVFEREGPILPVGEGSGLGRGYSLSMPDLNDPEGRQFEGSPRPGPAAIAANGLDNTVSSPEARGGAKIRRRIIPEPPWSDNELVQGLVMAEVLGPPRSKKRQIK